jgi:hypothetical protein
VPLAVVKRELQALIRMARDGSLDPKSSGLRTRRGVCAGPEAVCGGGKWAGRIYKTAAAVAATSLIRPNRLVVGFGIRSGSAGLKLQVHRDG